MANQSDILRALVARVSSNLFIRFLLISGHRAISFDPASASIANQPPSVFAHEAILFISSVAIAKIKYRIVVSLFKFQWSLISWYLFPLFIRRSSAFFYYFTISILLPDHRTVFVIFAKIRNREKVTLHLRWPKNKDITLAKGVGSVPALSGIVVAFVRRFVSPRLVLSRGRGRRRSYRAEVARSTRRKIRSPSFRTRPTPMPILSGRGWLETARTSNATSTPTLAPTLVTLPTALRPSLT